MTSPSEREDWIVERWEGPTPAGGVRLEAFYEPGPQPARLREVVEYDEHGEVVARTPGDPQFVRWWRFVTQDPVADVDRTGRDNG